MGNTDAGALRRTHSMPADKKTRIGLIAFLVLFRCLNGPSACGQTVAPSSDDEIRAVIVVVRHGVRSPIESETRRSMYNPQSWPLWPVAPGVLTQHGAHALELLGAYYRLRYPSLLQNVACDHPRIFVEANTTQRTIASAKAMIGTMVTDCRVGVKYIKEGSNPLFEPDAGGDVDRQEIVDATMGRMANRPEWFTEAFARPLARMHEVLFDCIGADCDKHKPDFRTEMIRNGEVLPRDPRTDTPVALGADFAENFLLQYTEGFPMAQVGWGRVDRNTLDDLMEMNTQYHDFYLRTPYEAQMAASELAARIRDTVLGVATATQVKGELGTQKDRFFLLVGHDSNLSWLGGLLHLDWLLPDQTFNATPPGSALVFEVHYSKSSHRNTVQVRFISQTLDEIRYLRPLTMSDGPSDAPVFMPGCSGAAPAYPCSVEGFARVISAAINPQFVQSSGGQTIQ